MPLDTLPTRILPVNNPQVMSIPALFPDDKCLKEGRRVVVVRPNFEAAVMASGTPAYRFNLSQISTVPISAIRGVYVDASNLSADGNASQAYGLLTSNGFHWQFQFPTIQFLPIIAEKNEDFFIFPSGVTGGQGAGKPVFMFTNFYPESWNETLVP